MIVIVLDVMEVKVKFGLLIIFVKNFFLFCDFYMGIFMRELDFGLLEVVVEILLFLDVFIFGKVIILYI